MNKMNVSLRDCFGIGSLDYEFDFGQDNVYCIYARNGSMKTSLTKVFQLIQQGKENDIKDVIYDKEGVANILIDGNPIRKDQVFAVSSFESAYESDITPLLVKGKIKDQLNDVFTQRTKLLKSLEILSGLKIKRVSQGETIYELENTIIKDFAFEEKSILFNLEALASYKPELECTNVKYAVIFDSTVLKKILGEEFQTGIQNYLSISEQIYDSYEYLKKGALTFPKLKALKKSLESNAFFVNKNHLYFTGDIEVHDIDALNSQIEEIDKKVKQTPEYRAIENLLSDSKGLQLKDVIETNPELIEFLSTDKLPILRKSLWGSYLKSEEKLLNTLISKFKSLSESIDSVNLSNTPWKQALDIFNQRFFVPFNMSITNFKGAIIGESVPQVEFTFSNGIDIKTVNRNSLEEMDVLSQGEKRALYLLNIIFDIERIKATGEQCVLVFDDIADSFDYKNKYAIIEYLYDMAQEANFYLIILTHNFDFHRTVSSRLDPNRKNRLIAGRHRSEVVLEEERYQRQPFKSWKQNLNYKNVLALIPFVRNLCEYGRDHSYSCRGNDFDFLTSLLHQKNDTHTIAFSDLEPLYVEYLGINAFPDLIDKKTNVIDKLYSVCDELTSQDTWLENKIILAMAIRHKAEDFMLREIKNNTGQFKWRVKNDWHYGGCQDFIDFASKKDQTRRLFNGYKQIGCADKLDTLNKVNIMAPEHIHINSFMYEPLIDMDITELSGLYSQVKIL